MISALVDHLCDCVGPICALVFALIGLSFAIYLGCFQKVFFVPSTVGGFTFIFLEFKGSYNNVSDVFVRGVKILQENKWMEYCEFNAGVYFDDPKKVKAAEMRSYCGFGSRKPIPAAVAEKMKEAGLQIREIPESPALVTIFPFRFFLSFIVAPIKVYSAAKSIMGKICMEKDYGIVETYTGPVIEKFEDMRFYFPTTRNPGLLYEHHA